MEVKIQKLRSGAVTPRRGSADAAVQAHRQALPRMEVFTYPAGHAFNREVDADAYHAPSAALARQRSLAFFAGHLG